MVVAYSCGAAPIWESPAFQDVVLARSLEGGGHDLPPPPKPTVKTVLESIALVAVQLGTLNNSAAGAPIKRAVAGVHAAFHRAADLGRILGQVTDATGLFELLTTFVAQVKALSPGGCLVVPGGFKNGAQQRPPSARARRNSASDLGGTCSKLCARPPP